MVSIDLISSKLNHMGTDGNCFLIYQFDLFHQMHESFKNENLKPESQNYHYFSYLIK